MSNVKKLAGQTAVYGLSTIAGRFLNYLLVPIFTRVFTQMEYGINSEFYAYISFFNILLTHGMETAFFRFAEKDRQQQVFANALISVLGVSSVFAFLFLLFGNQIASWVGNGDHPEYVWFSVGILFFDSVSAIPFALLRQQNKALRFALIKNLNILINISLNLYFLLLGPYAALHWDIQLPFIWPELGIANVFLANLLASAITTLLLSKELLGIGFGFNYDQWKRMLVYAIPMVWVGFAGMINETLDRILLLFVIPDADQAHAMNGIYAANYKLSIIITLFIQAYKYAAEPFFFAHAKTTEKRDLYARVMNYFIWICLFVFLLVMLFLHLFKLFIGADFHEGLQVVPILLFANIFLGVYYNVSIWYKLSDQTKKGALISAIGAVITIVLNLILIPKLGYVGCAWTTFFCYLSMMLIGYLWGQKYYPIPYNLGRAFLYTGAALLLYGLTELSLPYLDAGSAFGTGMRVLFLGVFVLLGFMVERKKSLIFYKS